MKRPLAIRGAATAAAAAAALLCAGLMARTDPVRRPQALAGGDILSVLLGDAKKDLSGAMVREADSYFHGGVADMHDLHHHHEHAEGETCEECGEGHDHDHEDGEVEYDEHIWLSLKNAAVLCAELANRLSQMDADHLSDQIRSAQRGAVLLQPEPRDARRGR